MSGSVHCVVSDDVARVTISHPARFNAMSRAMWRDLRQVFDNLRGGASLAAVVVEGEAPIFAPAGTSRSTRSSALRKPRCGIFTSRRSGVGCRPCSTATHR